MPFGFLKRRKPEASRDGRRPARAGRPAAGASTLHSGARGASRSRALTEDWRLRGRMQISGRLSDALNRREAIAITDVSWGRPRDGRSWSPRPGSRAWTRTT